METCMVSALFPLDATLRPENTAAALRLFQACQRVYTIQRNKKYHAKQGANGTSNRSVSAVLASRGLFLPISRAAAAWGASKGDTAAGY